ncbi:MAG: hydrolase [Acidobacteriota bacterium]|nr:MAG: hydrolase [Acidobacteriota bacterium]
MTNKHPGLLRAEAACLLVVDIQERFRTVMADANALIAVSVRLVKTFRALELPIIVTEQYPQGLGQTVEELREALDGEASPHAKTCFSACGSDEISSSLVEQRIRQVLVCGIEAHVCVSQTVHDLIQRGLSVHVAVDGVRSRKTYDRDVALSRMERAGAILTTSEAAAFELLEDARHPSFKKVQALYK